MKALEWIKRVPDEDDDDNDEPEPEPDQLPPKK